MGVPVGYEVGYEFEDVIENWLNSTIMYPKIEANNINETLQFLFDSYNTK